MKQILFVLSTVLPICLYGGALPDQPIEVGTIAWGRNLETALAESGETGKPVFLLFQEVPGCSGCQQFGQEVLSNPLIKAGVEESFVPLLVHNNKGGEDKRVLELYKEPAWNFQIVRFLDADGKDIIPRRDRVWDTGGVAQRMITALEKAKRQVPAYLVLLADESDRSNLSQVAFATHCFWTGERLLGAIAGVTATEAGWFEGKEVTLVTWHRNRIELEALVLQARRMNLADTVYLSSKAERAELPRTNPGIRIRELTDDYRMASDSDQKRQIQGTAFAGLDLSAAQATKVNAFARTDPDQALPYLTQDQRESLRD